LRHNPAEHGRLRRLFDRMSADSQVPVTIAIELANKRFVVFELTGPTTRRIFGIPYGFWVGAIGFLLSAIAVLAIAREARPLRQLSNAVGGFAESGTPQTVAESGAPEIRSLIGAFNRMQGRIAALLEGRTMLLGAISHDLRTLLTRLRLRVEQIPDAVSREKAAREIEDMTAMLDDGLAVARGIAASDRREIVDLGELISDIVSGFDQARVECSPSPMAGSFRVDGDPVALRRVVTNLVDNALQHANRCRVSLSHREQRLELVVDDDGPGIPETKRAVIFEPFYRLDAARTRGNNGSSGLGLAIASTIIQAHRGQISVADSPLGGARFTVSLAAQA
jgi:two-component system osmolarity sensor histidine kinase EnvZ